MSKCWLAKVVCEMSFCCLNVFISSFWAGKKVSLFRKEPIRSNGPKDVYRCSTWPLEMVEKVLQKFIHCLKRLLSRVFIWDVGKTSKMRAGKVWFGA